jgi:hypothetical protein
VIVSVVLVLFSSGGNPIINIFLSLLNLFSD